MKNRPHLFLMFAALVCSCPMMANAQHFGYSTQASSGSSISHLESPRFSGVANSSQSFSSISNYVATPEVVYTPNAIVSNLNNSYVATPVVAAPYSGEMNLAPINYPVTAEVPVQSAPMLAAVVAPPVAAVQYPAAAESFAAPSMPTFEPQPVCTSGG